MKENCGLLCVYSVLLAWTESSVLLIAFFPFLALHFSNLSTLQVCVNLVHAQLSVWKKK